MHARTRHSPPRGDIMRRDAPRFAKVWVPFDDVFRPWLPYESKAGQWLYALFVDPFLALTAGLLYQHRKGYREPLHETLIDLQIRRRIIASDREVLRRHRHAEDEDEAFREEHPHAVVDFENGQGFIARADPRIHGRAEEAAEALNKCPYETAMTALDEVKTCMPDGKYKAIADALMLAHRAKRQRR